MIKISIVKIIKKELKSQITEIAPFLCANIEKKIESPKFISRALFYYLNVSKTKLNLSVTSSIDPIPSTA